MPPIRNRLINVKCLERGRPVNLIVARLLPSLIALSLLQMVQAAPDTTDSAATATQPCDEGQPQRQSEAVTEWFKNYDQIRTAAEMNLGDKLQSCLLAASKPDRKNAALASRMIEKYATAAAKMKELKALPETRELQDGYIQYFTTARQLFADYLDAQEAVPFSNQSLVPTKKKLEDLDKANKRLDAALRKQFVITRHR